MNLGVEHWRLILSLVHFVWAALLTIYVWVANRQRVTADRLKRLEDETEEKLNRHSIRLSCLETDIKHLPDQKAINRLSERMDTLNGTLNQFGGRLEGINRAVDLMNDFLINQGKK